MTRHLWIPIGALALIACGEEGEAPPAGAPVEVATPGDFEAARAALLDELTRGAPETYEALAAAYPAEAAPLNYDPTEAAHLDQIQASPLALSDAELAVLGREGLVIAETPFASFTLGYKAIYEADLPVFISGDSLLDALHQAYDAMLEGLEEDQLIPALDQMLAEMRAALAAGAADAYGEATVAEADLYLEVARALLHTLPADEMWGAAQAPDFAVSAAASARIDLAIAAAGPQAIKLAGDDRLVDFSQFEPRGHYSKNPKLRAYFRAMMWLGRVDARPLDVIDGAYVLKREQLAFALALRAAMDEAATARWRRLDMTIGAFVGERDSMSVPEIDALIDELGGGAPAALAARLEGMEDEALAALLSQGAYGSQRIAGHLLAGGVEETAPLPYSFLLLGQRYVLDSHVFSNLVYDRLIERPWRMMPDPRDAAFAALGNNHAARGLQGELETYSYAPRLHLMRGLAEAHGPEFWTANLYNLWLGALRALSPRPERPQTAAWMDRALGAQLASWAQLRRDTILYAKQSYTGMASCEYPDAYVEPAPELFEALQAYATHGRGLVDSLGANDAYGRWFDHLERVAGVLGEIAARQQTGEPLTEAQLAFVNDPVTVEAMSGGYSVQGWYSDLLFDQSAAGYAEPTIADVHTQPTDEVGAMVGRVLHVGTGNARAMVITVETCTGPKAYMGLSSTYYEVITEGFERLDDDAWARRLYEESPQTVEWLRHLSAP